MSEYPRKLLDAVAQTIIEAHYPGQAGVSYHRLAHQVLDVVRAFDAAAFDETQGVVHEDATGWHKGRAR
jgi:hypothetical protein